jgi:hypothetical protein
MEKVLYVCNVISNQPPFDMNTTTQKTQILFNSLTGVEKILYNAERNFYLDNGYSEVEADEAGFIKIQNVRKLKNYKGLLRK